MDKKQALIVLTQESISLDDETKQSIYDNIDNFTADEIDELGNLLCDEAEEMLHMYDTNIEFLERRQKEYERLLENKSVQ